MITLDKMDTLQISHALQQDRITSKIFCGVFPSDRLPESRIIRVDLL